MINFRQKTFTEYDAMISLYKEMRNSYLSNRFETITSDRLPAILKGNNVVIEKFVIVHNFFGKDKYRMYIKFGANAKMPDNVRLPSRPFENKIGNLSFHIKNNSDISNESGQKLFTRDKKKKDKNNGGQNNGQNNGPKTLFSAEFNPYFQINHTINKELGEVIDYNKSTRTLVLEFETIDNAIRSLDILPFGLGYHLYLLDV